MTATSIKTIKETDNNSNAQNAKRRGHPLARVDRMLLQTQNGKQHVIRGVR